MRQIIGSGPFRFVANEAVPGDRYVYERFEGYVPREGGGSGFTAGPKRASLQRVEWRVIPDAGTAAAALQAGEVDWWDQALPDLAPMLARNKARRVEASDLMGLNGYPGWPNSPRIKTLRAQWFDAPTLSEQQAIARQMQAQNWQDVTFIPLGQYFLPTAYRAGIRRGNKDITAFWDLTDG